MRSYIGKSLKWQVTLVEVNLKQDRKGWAYLAQWGTATPSQDHPVRPAWVRAA